MSLDEALEPTTSPARLRELAAHEDVAVRRALTAHPGTPPEVLFALGEVFPRALATNPAFVELARTAPALVRGIPASTLRMLLTVDALPEVVWATLAEHEDVWLRREVLAHPKIPAAILTTLARVVASRELASIAANPGAPAELLVALAQHEDPRVRGGVAENPATPAAVLEALAGDPQVQVRRDLAENPGAPARALARLLDDHDLHVFTSAAVHPSLPESMLEALARRDAPYVRTLLAANPSTPPRLLAKLADDAFSVAAERVAVHPNTPAKTLWALARSGRECVLEALTTRADAPRELLVEVQRRRGQVADPCAGLRPLEWPGDAECVYSGQNFRVYRFTHQGEARGLKVAIGGTSMGLFEAERRVGWVSTSWDLQCTLGSPPRSVAWLSPRAMLESEAERLAATRGTWNHAAHGLVACEVDGARAPGLVMEWHDGDRLGALAPSVQRALLPRMLPALWGALAAARHGDLHPDNLILSPGRERFHLIDPGALVVHVRREYPGSERRLGFVTNAEHYPLLPPYYAPGFSLRRGDGLRGHWERYKWSVSLSRVAPIRPTILSNVFMRAVSPSVGDFTEDHRAATGEPCPADLLALGLLYYRVLTGASAFPGLTAPAWSRLTTLDDRIDGAAETDAALDRGVIPPSALAADVTEAEERLALALLDLQVPNREALRALAVGAAASVHAEAADGG